MPESVRVVQDLHVYQMAKSLAMDVFVASQQFPALERYSLTDQIRRSSRSVCANLAEAWQKRNYRSAFVAKLSDSAGEAAETTVWLEFAEECRYLNAGEGAALRQQSAHVTAQLVTMMRHPDPWLLPNR